MNITKDIVQVWTNKAQDTLKQAQELCSTTEKLLQSITHQLSTNLPKKLEEIDVKYHEIKRLNNIIFHYISFVQDKVDKQIIEGYNEKYKKLKGQLQDLEDILSQLTLTSVPSILIESDDHRKSEYLLKDFISTDEIILLVENIEIYNNNMEQMHKFMNDSFHETVLSPFNNVISKKYNKMANMYDEITVENSMNSNLVITILKENSSLEHELVSILQMLTNHYDQCIMGLKSFETANNINFEVLRDDSLEVSEVLKDLKSICDIIVNNEIRSKKFVTSILTKIDNMIDMMTDLNSIYAKFKSTNLFQLIIFLSKYDELLKISSIETVDHPLDAYLEILQQLIYHYQQFLTVFKSKYLVELHHQQFTYPRKFLNKLNTFLNEELYNFQQEERTRRKQWLNKYGDFIPKQFKLPGEIQPSIVQVITEGIQDDSVKQEKEILDIIKHFMAS